MISMLSTQASVMETILREFVICQYSTVTYVNNLNYEKHEVVEIIPLPLVTI
jgi:hypothetical protein